MEAEVLHHTKKTRAKTVHFLLAMGRRLCVGGGSAGAGRGRVHSEPRDCVISSVVDCAFEKRDTYTTVK